MKKAIFAYVVVFGFLVGCYVGNVIKLVNCDFDSSGSWKGEIVYAIGLTGAAPITVWFDLD